MARELYQGPTRISLVYQAYVPISAHLVGLYQVHQVCTRLYFANLANSLCESLPSHQYCTRVLQDYTRSVPTEVLLFLRDTLTGLYRQLLLLLFLHYISSRVASNEARLIINPRNTLYPFPPSVPILTGVPVTILVVLRCIAFRKHTIALIHK